MTEVAFHTGLPDPLAFSCRLLRKVYRRGLRALAAVPAPLVVRLDQALWTFDEQDFVPHLRLGAGPVPAGRVQRTPIWLLGLAEGEPPPEPAALAQRHGLPEPPGVLLNLSGALPAEPAAFDRIVEPVGADAAELRAARQRWRAYEALGLAVRHHAAGAAE